jgi:hypothetical protein
MLKKLVPAVLGALLIASPVLTVTTAAAAQADQGTAKTAPMKSSHHKMAKHHKASHHMMKKHSKKAKAKKAPPQG